MPTFEIQAPDGGTYQVDGPDEAGALAALRKMHGGQQPQSLGGKAMDFFKSIPGGALGGLSSALSAGGQAAQLEMGQPVDVPNPHQTKQSLEQNVTGELPKPQGRAGRYGETVGEFLGNPGSYVGPGGALLKLGGAVAGGLASEAGGQATEGTPYETAGRIGGALAGGVAAGKTLAPAMPRATTPTLPELKGAATRGGQFGGYEGALQSDMRLKPSGFQEFAKDLERELSGPPHGFSGGERGTASKTFDVLERVRDPIRTPADLPPDYFTAANLDTVRANLKNIAKEVQQTQGGAVVPTPDASAATIALKRLAAYTENIPQAHIMAGDASAYSNAIKEANANYGAYARGRDFDARLTKAENATDRQIAGSLDAQIKQKAGQILDRGARGMNEAERAQVQLINSGTLGSNTLRQLGRGGAGVVPLMGQAAIAGPLAAATGGASVIPQLGLMAALYGARKGSEAITKGRANKLAEMLAQRSPEYERRVANLPAANPAPNTAALARALMVSGSR